MKLRVSRRRRLIGIFAAIVLAAIIGQYVWYLHEYTDRRTAVVGMILLDAESRLILFVYQNTGRLIMSRPELFASGYYPYVRADTGDKDEAATSLTFAATSSTISIKGVSQYKRFEFSTTNNFPKIAETPTAIKLLGHYLAGESALYRAAKSFSQEYIIEEGGRGDMPDEELEGKRKILPAPNANWDLPETQDELQQYISYVEAIEGESQLDDPWGMPVKFGLAGRLLECQSAGPDRRFGTADDIKVYHGLPK